MIILCDDKQPLLFFISHYSLQYPEEQRLAENDVKKKSPKEQVG